MLSSMAAPVLLVMALTLAVPGTARNDLLKSCSGLVLPPGTLEATLGTLGEKHGFTVTLTNPKVGAIAVSARTLAGPTCVTALSAFLDDLNLSFALSQNPQGGILRLVIIDLKSQPSGGPATTATAEPATEPEIAPSPEVSPELPKTDVSADPEEMIDRGDGMKVYRTPPKYVPMSPGLVPPNAQVAGPEVLGEGIFGTGAMPVNAVLPVAPKPKVPPASSFPGAPRPLVPTPPKPGPTTQP